MSSTLMWRPPHRGKELPDALKYALCKRWADQSIRTVFSNEDGCDMAYLQGLRDAGVDGAQELLDAVKRYGEVEVWEQY